MRIFLISDDPKSAAFLSRALRENAYAVDASENIEESFHWAEINKYDLVLLDVRFGDSEHGEICSELRRVQYRGAILMLTSNSVKERVEGLRAGADDCLARPFKLIELLARIQALVRRSFSKPVGSLCYADLELDYRYRRVRRGNDAVALTSKEFALLEFLLLRASETISRSEIVEHVWDLQFETGTNVLEVHVNHLRQKIDRDHKVKLIHTVRGVGYRLGAPA